MCIRDRGHVPKCPYIVLQGMGSDNFSADGIVYHEIEDIDIELYCDKKDPKMCIRDRDRRKIRMNLIEDWGVVLSGYVPDLPKSTGRHGEMLCLILIP